MTKKTEILVTYHELTPLQRASIALVAAIRPDVTFLDHAEPSVQWVSDEALTDEMSILAGELADLEATGIKVKSVSLREVTHG